MSIKNLIVAIASGNAMETEAAFNAAMADKIAARLDDKRIEVASNMFAVDEAADPGKALAKSIAAKHKNMKVSSFGKEHYIHHKDDEEGESGTVKIHHDGSKFHMHHEGGGVAGSDSKHSGSAEEVAEKAHKAISGS